MEDDRIWLSITGQLPVYTHIYLSPTEWWQRRARKARNKAVPILLAAVCCVLNHFQGNKGPHRRTNLFTGKGQHR